MLTRLVTVVLLFLVHEVKGFDIPSKGILQNLGQYISNPGPLSPQHGEFSDKPSPEDWRSSRRRTPVSVFADIVLNVVHRIASIFVSIIATRVLLFLEMA